MTLAKIACAAVIASLVASARPTHAAPPVKTAAFVHVVAAGNQCPADSGASTIINHPMANGNANAVIVVTYNAGATSGSGFFLPAGPLAVYFDDAAVCGTAGRWVIYGLENPGPTPFVIGQQLNVFVAAP